MFTAILLAQGVAAQIMAAPADLSPETRILIAPVAAAIARVRAEQAALPPPKDDAEKLLRMRDLEQAPRAAMMAVDFQKIPPAERQAANTAMWKQITPIDEANQKALLEMLPPEGWFTISRYGKEASRAAFLIVDRSLVPCNERHGDGCETPWDYCCDTDRLPTSKATVKFVDEEGKTVPVDSRQLLGVKELQTVVVSGTAKRDLDGNLTVLAKGLHVRNTAPATEPKKP